MQSGEQLMTLVPDDAPLEAEVNVAGADAGYVHPGNPVTIKLEPSRSRSTARSTGTVRVVSPDSFTSNPDETASAASQQHAAADSGAGLLSAAGSRSTTSKLHDTPPGFQLMPGMPVTADVKVGKRTVLSYLLAACCRCAWTGCASREAGRRTPEAAWLGCSAGPASAVSPAARLRQALQRAEGGELARGLPGAGQGGANAAIAEAQFWVGKAYLDGPGVPPSRATAAHWLRARGHRGQVEAQSVLAALYLTGAAKAAAGRRSGCSPTTGGAEPDFEQALRLGDARPPRPGRRTRRRCSATC